MFGKSDKMLIEAYTDADYTGSVVDRKSIVDCCIFFGGNLILGGVRS